MKKEYIQPALIVRDVKVNTILAGSEFTVSKTSNSYTASDFGAKESDGFSDDDVDTWGCTFGK